MKNNKKRIGVFVAVLILLVAIFTGYTFSKYTQSVTVKSTSAVAAWKFSGQLVNAKNSSASSTISLADTIESDTIAEHKIAPGTKGDFSIVINAEGSEVDLSYIVELVDETNKPRNLIFTYDGKTYSDLTSLLADVKNDEKIFSGKILHNDQDKEVTYNIGWEWPYETKVGDVAQDEIDLQDGQTISDYVFTVKITGSQLP